MEDDRVFAEALNDCLDALSAARNLSTPPAEREALPAAIQDCLARHPEQAARLGDLLQLGVQVKAMPLPGPTTQMLAAGERRLVQAIQARRPARSRVSDVRAASAQRRAKAAPWPPRPQGRPNLWKPLAALAGAVAVLWLALALVAGGGRAYRAWRANRATPVATVVALAEDHGSATPLPALAQKPMPTEGATQPASPPPAPAAAAAAATPTAHTSFLPLASRPIPPAQALLQGLSGLVQVQAANGAWSSAKEAQLLDAGRRIRTGALSGADLVFYDGSTARLGPNTELLLDQLGQDPKDLSRVVVLTQSVGQTDHRVEPAPGSSGQYTVYTPSGVAAARGTLFHVSVGPAQAATISVDQGAVAVTNLRATVLVVAGQQTALRADLPPGQPVFRVTGEGVVEAIGATWRIAGQDFLTDANTQIAGDPQVGDWVRVEGHLLPNGDRMADHIQLLHRAEDQRFTITGEVQARGETAWTVAGQTIAISETTRIDDRPSPIAVGERVRVQGVILRDGTLLAQSIVRLEPQGWPFGFVGVVEQISDAAWVVSGISLTVDSRTSMAPGLAVGDIVQVRGVRLPPPSGEGEWLWLVRSISPYRPLEQAFEFVGLVERMDPWVVSGIELATDAWTEIEQGIAVGDRVKVEGRILPDGAWLAEEIALLEGREGLPFKFSGWVESVDPWVVSGVSLTVDGRTKMRGPIAVGDKVKVKGVILPDGAWLATEIKRSDHPLGRGCMHITSLVVSADAGQVLLQDGVTLHIDSVPTQGQVQARSVIQIYYCVDSEGHITVIAIVVLYQLEPEVVVQPTPTRPPNPGPTRMHDDDDDDDDGDDDDCDDDDDDGDDDDEGRKCEVVICHKEGGHRRTMSVSWEGWVNGHQQHGDTLGPCD